VEVKSGFVIKVDKSKVLPVFQFPALPPPKKKEAKKKEVPPKMQIKLGTLLTPKQKAKLSIQIQQEQEQVHIVTPASSINPITTTTTTLQRCFVCM